MTSDSYEDINDVLDDVIVKINRITDHLRVSGENEAANQFTRDMTTTFRALYNVIAPWDMEKCLLRASQNAHTAGTISSINQALATPSPGNTWASIAANEPVADQNGIIKFRPSDSVKRTVQLPEAKEHAHDSRDRRVVWISPWPQNRPLAEVSQQMLELGAIYSMAFVPEEQAVCIIFQHARCAVQFMHNCAGYIGRTGNSPLGKDYSIFPGVPYPLNDGLRRMDNPYNERRRLTFARSQLFSNGISESRFRNDVEQIVGASNIELLWLFNTGNATVVFSAVPLAKLVKDKFNQYSRTSKHPYEGVKVSYSHDPCERDLHLVSQIPGHANFIGSNGTGRNFASSRSMRSNTVSSETSGRLSITPSDYQVAPKRHSTVSKVKVDEDGWQTVSKKKK
ncbi:hypothetical protein LTS08_008699 [Lithohypha guttulata]|nr:hypothetical protein LTS08_008699 [Lithohypha guttulata]